MRTHHCNEIRSTDENQQATLVGWVQSSRDHGGVIFIDLRDREGITQVVFKPEDNAELAKISHQLREEDVIQVTGTVEKRLKTAEVDTTNDAIATGEVELVAQELVILNKAEVLPFQLDKELSNEDLRLTYRYLDLRRPRLTRNLKLRHKVSKALRDYLDEQEFLEVETPILSKSTPEGARDFLVPSRLQAGKFYALPQAPQQYKQLLMVSGIERYFQIARCFRDEDLRSDRQPEFTQVDMEASFINQAEMIELVEGLLANVFQKSLGVEIPKSFEQITYQDAMNTYGSDKPDTRFDLKLVDISDVFATSEFKVFSGALKRGGVIKAFNAKGFANISTGQVEKLTQLAQENGAKGLAYIQVRGEEIDTWRSPITKFFTPEELTALKEKLNIEAGDLILFGADDWSSVCNVLGTIRLAVAQMQGLLEGNTDNNFLWVTEFPLLEYDKETSRWHAVHHPFTRPLDVDLEKFKAGDYEGVRAQAYDVVLNGHELGGGSIRIHEQDLQSQMFEALGIDKEEQELMFSHILKAFSYGAPPHGGLALGLDRLTMLVCGEQSIREVIAFPKNNKGMDLMSDSPATVDFKQLRDLRIKSTYNSQQAQVEAQPQG